MKKISILFSVAVILGVLSSSAQACWLGKKELALEPAALIGARIYCLHEETNPNVSYADQLRYGELADMIGEGAISYEKSFDPKTYVSAGEVWHLYLASVELNQKLKKEAAVKAWKIKKIKQEARAKAGKKTT